MKIASDLAGDQVIKQKITKWLYAPVESVQRIQSAPEWRRVEIISHQLKMQNNSGSWITIMSTEMWAKLALLSLTSNVKFIERFDGYLLRREVSLDNEIVWNGQLTHVKSL